MFVGLREITNYLNIELLLKDGEIHLTNGSISRTLNLKDYSNNKIQNVASLKNALMT
jgi:hypothetical protein